MDAAADSTAESMLASLPFCELLMGDMSSTSTRSMGDAVSLRTLVVLARAEYETRKSSPSSSFTVTAPLWSLMTSSSTSRTLPVYVRSPAATVLSVQIRPS